MAEYPQALDWVAAQARARADEFDVLRYRLQYDDDLEDVRLDAYIETLAAPIVAAIDCTVCANCCRSLRVELEAGDAERLAAGVDVPLVAILTEHVAHDLADENPYGYFKHSPCAFLQGTRCGIYAHRPQACREYPFLTPDFRWMLADLIAGAGLCPIIYHVLDAVRARVDAITRGEL